MGRLADQKAAEALKAAGGNHHEALKVLLGWALQDFDLLKDMTKPFLRGVGGYALERAKNVSPDAESHAEDDADLVELDKAEETGEIGAELVRSILSKTGHTFGTQERYPRGSNEARRVKASASHEATMRLLARETKKK